MNDSVPVVNTALCTEIIVKKSVDIMVSVLTAIKKDIIKKNFIMNYNTYTEKCRKQKCASS